MLMGCWVLLPVRPVPGGSHVLGPLNPRWNQGKQSGIPGKAAWGRWEGEGSGSKASISPYEAIPGGSNEAQGL